MSIFWGEYANQILDSTIIIQLINIYFCVLSQL